MGRNPKAEVEISAHSRGLAAKLREARAKFSTFGAELKKNVFGKDLVEKGFWSKAGASMVGNVGANAMGKVASYVHDGFRAAVSFEDALVRLQIAARKGPAEMQVFGDSVRETSKETGIGADKIMSAAHAYVALTGDMDGAAASSRQWARVAQATNSQVIDIAQTAAALKQNLKIKPGEMETAFSALAIQGKEGAIELKDLAGQLANIAPMWAQFKGGTGVQGLKELGAALQVAKQGFGGDASETVTGIQNLLQSLTKHEKYFRKNGKSLVLEPDGKGGKQYRNVLDIVRDIGETKLAKNPALLVKALGSVEAYRAYIQLSQNKELLDDLVKKAGDANVIARDFGTYMESPAGRMAAATEQMKNAIAEAFTPERIELFANAMEHVAGGLVSAFETMDEIWERITGKDEKASKNPFEAQPEDQNASWLSWGAQFGGGSAVALDKIAQSQVARATEANIAAQPGAAGDAARAQFADRDAFNEVWDKRKKGSKAARVRRAVIAANDESESGSSGRRVAGQRILESEGVSNAERDRIYNEMLTAQLERAATNIATKVEAAVRDGMAKQNSKPITVTADGNKIVDVQRGATQHRSRPDAW